MFFWSRQGKQQQLCTSSWGGMYLCVHECERARLHVCVSVCVLVNVCVYCSGCGADGEGHTKLSPGNYILPSIHKKRRRKIQSARDRKEKNVGEEQSEQRKN